MPLLVTGCAAHETRPPQRAPTATVAIARNADNTASITVTYREAANVFEIMDNVSSWLPGKCDEEYRAYWNERFGITPADEQRFASYKQLRKRSYPRPPDGQDGSDPRTTSLFGPVKPIDRFAAAFYDSQSLDEAFVKLGDVATAQEIAELKAFYAVYRPQYESLLVESKAYLAIASATSTKLEEAHADAYATGLAQFYGVTSLPRFTALYVWWPPVENVTANSRDRFLLLKYNPAKHGNGAASNIDIPIHEFVHYASAHQSEEQKRALTRTFLAGCDPTADVKPVKILEEPLAVAHQKLFLSTADPQHFDASVPWYGGDRWIDPFAKALFAQVKEARAAGRTIDDALMTSAAKSCATLYAARSR